MPTDTEFSFARHLANLGGWMAPSALTVDEEITIVDWLERGMLIERTSGRLAPQPVIELTDAGRAWCRENGIGRCSTPT